MSGGFIARSRPLAIDQRTSSQTAPLRGNSCRWYLECPVELEGDLSAEGREEGHNVRKQKSRLQQGKNWMKAARPLLGVAFRPIFARIWQTHREIFVSY